LESWTSNLTPLVPDLDILPMMVQQSPREDRNTYSTMPGEAAMTPLLSGPASETSPMVAPSPPTAQLRLKTQPTFTVCDTLPVLTRPSKPGKEFTEYAFKPDVGKVIPVASAGTLYQRKRKIEQPIGEKPQEHSQVKRYVVSVVFTL
jgi:hypothetical protein